MDNTPLSDALALRATAPAFGGGSPAQPPCSPRHLCRMRHQAAVADTTRPAAPPHERVRLQGDLFEVELEEPDSCSPWSCRSGAPVQSDFDTTA